MGNQSHGGRDGTRRNETRWSVTEDPKRETTTTLDGKFDIDVGVAHNPSMKLSELRQPPLNTSLMGVIRAVADYFKLDYSTPFLYGGSGHAFLANVHAELCPSGPYCWNQKRFLSLVGNLGIEMTDLGFYGGDSGENRGALEAQISELLENDRPCAVLNLENQVIVGRDESGFVLTQPWGSNDSVTPAHLEFSTWKEFNDEFHATFYSFRKIAPIERSAVIKESLEYAIDLHRHPSRYTDEPYGVGPIAYQKWRGAIELGHGGEHGAWWNATVWSECRRMAADYLREAAPLFRTHTKRIEELSESYLYISKRLLSASQKEMGATEKIEILRDAETIEAGAVEKASTIFAELGV